MAQAAWKWGPAMVFLKLAVGSQALVESLEQSTPG
jgi:hypothetical protein